MCVSAWLRAWECVSMFVRMYLCVCVRARASANVSVCANAWVWVARVRVCGRSRVPA